MNLSFIQELSGPWLITETARKIYSPLVHNVLKGNSISTTEEIKLLKEESEQRAKPQFAISNHDSFEVKNKYSFDNVPKGSIAIIKIDGPITKSSGYCNKGIDQTIAELNEAGANSNIIGVILKTHSPGGSAFACEDLYLATRSFRQKYNKPIEGLINNQAASAGYFAICGVETIWISGQTCEAGCIGTMTTLYNYDEYFQSIGIKEIIVRATKSDDKNEAYYQALEGDVTRLQKEVLDPLNEGFLKKVIEGRKGKINISKENILSGKTYYGKDIIKVGLADKEGSLDDIFKSINRKNNKIQRELKIKNNKMDNVFNMSLDDLSAKLAVLNSQEDVQADEVVLVENAIKLKTQVQENAKLEGQLIATESLNEDLKKEKKANSESISSLQNDLKAANDKVASLELSNDNGKEVADLKNTIAENQKTINANVENIAELEKSNAAYMEFINSKFGDGTSDKFVSNDDGNIEQPNVTPSRKQTIKDINQTRRNTVSAVMNDILKEKK